jgi:Arc/MetJ-type ribon-helix-helix transcriptional regulator
MTEKEHTNLFDLRLKPGTYQQIEEIAHRRGYDSASDYVRALILSDAFDLGERLKIDDEGEPKKNVDMTA